jgi:DNA-binding MarR family transcriptional regulator
MLTNQFDPNESEQFVDLILRLSHRVAEFRELNSARAGVSGVQLRALLLLSRAAGRELTFTALHQKLETSKPNVTTLVRRLEKRGLVERRSSEEDGRVIHLRLTPHAEEVVSRVQPAIQAATDGLLALLQPDELSRVTTIANTMLGHLDALIEQSRTQKGTL